MTRHLDAALDAVEKMDLLFRWNCYGPRQKYEQYRRLHERFQLMSADYERVCAELTEAKDRLDCERKGWDRTTAWRDKEWLAKDASLAALTAELEAARGGWRTDLENAPKDRGNFLCYSDGEVRTAYYEPYSGSFSRGGITHWMPFPPAPEATP